MLAFVLDFLLCLTFLYLPGTVLLTLMRCNALSTITLAPLPTLAYYALASQVFALVHIPASALSLGGSCLLLFLVLGLVIHVIKKQPTSLLTINHKPVQITKRIQLSFSLICIVLFIAVGLGFYSYLFCRNADSPDMFLQNYDNVTHLARMDRGNTMATKAPLRALTKVGTEPPRRPKTRAPMLCHNEG